MTFLCQGTKEGLERKDWQELVSWLFYCTLDWCCLLCSYHKLLQSHNCLIAIRSRVRMTLFPQGASSTVKQPSHFNNFIIKNLSVKPMKLSKSLKKLLFWIFSLMTLMTFTKINRPNQNSNLVTAVEGNLTAWIWAANINWPVQTKLF